MFGKRSRSENRLRDLHLQILRYGDFVEFSGEDFYRIMSESEAEWDVAVGLNMPSIPSGEEGETQSVAEFVVAVFNSVVAVAESRLEVNRIVVLCRNAKSQQRLSESLLAAMSVPIQFNEGSLGITSRRRTELPDFQTFDAGQAEILGLDLRKRVLFSFSVTPVSPR